MIGYFEILGAVSIWAFFNGVLVKGIRTSGVGVGFWTGLVGAVIYLLIIDSGAISSLNQVQTCWLAGLGLFAALNNACFYSALKISIPNAALFHYLAPMLVIILNLSVPMFHEPVAISSVSALLLGFVGIVYMARPNLKEGNRKLIYLGLGSAVFYSLEIAISGYLSQDLGVRPETSAFFKLTFQAGVMLCLAWLFNESVQIKSKTEWLKIIGGGILLYLSFVLYFSGAETVGDLHRGILSYIDRIGAIVLGCWLFKEERAKLTKEVWIGGALILGASTLLLF